MESLSIIALAGILATMLGGVAHGDRRRDAEAADSPRPSHLEAVAVDASRDRLVLVGGARLGGEGSFVDLDETWEWDGSRWHAVPATSGGPGPRRGHAMAYDAARQCLVTLVSDARSRRLLLYGGVTPPRGLVADLWLRSESGWSLHAPDPVAEQGPRRPAFTAARGAFIGVSVGDLEASVRWYSEKLGLAVVMRPPKIEKSTAVILEGGGLIVELMHHDDAVPLASAAPSVTRDYMVHGIFKAGLVVDDFDKAIAELRARGVPIAIGPFAATAEQRANAIIRDNAGNFIQLFGAR